MWDILAIASKVGMVSSGIIFAQDGGGFTFDPSNLINYGAIGLFLIFFLTDRISTKSTVDRLIAERDKAEKSRDEVIREQFDKVIPLLESINTRQVPILESLVNLMERVETLLEAQSGTTK